MNLLYKGLDINIELKPDCINSIVIENIREFEKFVRAVDKQLNKIEEMFVLENNYANIDFLKHVHVITSPLELRYERKTVQKKLYSALQEDLELSDTVLEIAELYALISEKLDLISLQSDYSVEYSNDFSSLDILKNFDVHLKEPEGTFTERFLEIATTYHKLLGMDIFIIVNCDSYINDDDMQELEKWMKYEEVILVFLRNSQRKSPVKENEFIIDEDWCIV